MHATSNKPHVEFDDLLDIPAANDVDRAPAADDVERTPALRSLPRWALRAEVTLHSEDNLYAGLSYDVSTGGVFVATVDTPPLGARVDVSVALADGSELELAGVVRWIRDAALASDGLPPGCGIEWKGLPLEAVRALEAFATTREPLLWLVEAA